MSTQASTTARLADLIEAGAGLTGFPWPDRICDTAMRIGRDGTWYHQGRPIGRMRLCQLFATVLQRDPDGVYWLVTPAERGEIEVEDSPFLAVELRAEQDAGGQVLRFRTNLDHWVEAGPDHAIRIAASPVTGDPTPYIHIRDGLEARIARPVFYELAELAREDAVGGSLRYCVDSRGRVFEIGAAQ